MCDLSEMKHTTLKYVVKVIKSCNHIDFSGTIMNTTECGILDFGSYTLLNKVKSKTNKTNMA